MDRRSAELDRRVLRTREAVLRAFTELVFERRYETIRTADLIAVAGIGRATFYEHFRGKDEVLLAAMEPILLTLANAAAGRGSKAHVAATLEHVWERRSACRAILTSSAARKIERRLAAMIESRLDEAAAPTALAAAAAAAAQLAMLRLWVTGEAGCSTGVLALRMITADALHRP